MFVGDAILGQGGDHQLCLIGGDDLIVEALKEDHRTSYLVGRMEGSSLAVEISPLWIRANKPIEISRLKLVSIPGQRFKVSDTEMARSSLEGVSKGEGG